MMSQSDFRPVSREEVDHFHAFGWVKLERFLPPAHVASLLAFAKDKMGEDGTISPNPGKFSYFNSLPVRQIESPLFSPIVRHYARSVVALRDRRSDSGVRYFNDSFGVKLPSASIGGHGKSDWHQDFAAQVSDRSGGMVFWTALVDMAPEKGTMAFLNGSHRHGVMGDYRTYGDGNLLDAFPDLIEDCPSSGYLTMAAGDVTVHTDLCVHSAAPNTTGDPRWTYLMQLNPADARWTGAPAISFDTATLEHLQPLDEARFPQVA
jgi:hypothetical protein